VARYGAQTCVTRQVPVSLVSAYQRGLASFGTRRGCSAGAPLTRFCGDLYGADVEEWHAVNGVGAVHRLRIANTHEEVPSSRPHSLFL
jgi:hypothetical protein